MKWHDAVTDEDLYEEGLGLEIQKVKFRSSILIEASCE